MKVILTILTPFVFASGEKTTNETNLNFDSIDKAYSLMMQILESPSCVGAFIKVIDEEYDD